MKNNKNLVAIAILHEMANLTVAQEIVDFWFGPIKDAYDEIPKEKVMKWYRGGKEYDDLIRDKYEDLMIKALNEKSTDFDAWKSDPIGIMALILMVCHSKMCPFDFNIKFIFRSKTGRSISEEYLSWNCRCIPTR